MSGLEVFAPLPVVVQAGGADVEIAPLRLRDLPVFARAVGEIQSFVVADLIDEALRLEPEASVAVIVTGTGRGREWAEGLSLPEAAAVLRGIVEANADFFARLAPDVQREAKAKLDGVLTALRGPTSSPGSSSADTGSTTH